MTRAAALGFDVGTSPSLGLRLVVSLAEQLQGRLQVDGDDGGATFRLAFPVRG